MPEPGRPNLAREIVFEAGLPMSIEAQTISSYCITGLRTITVIADAIARGRIEVGVAGGVDSLSHSSPDTFREPTAVCHCQAPSATLRRSPRPAGGHTRIGRHTPLRSRIRACEPCGLSCCPIPSRASATSTYTRRSCARPASLFSPTPRRRLLKRPPRSADSGPVAPPPSARPPRGPDPPTSAPATGSRSFSDRPVST